jgi:hypothetical protein
MREDEERILACGRTMARILTRARELCRALEAWERAPTPSNLDYVNQQRKGLEELLDPKNPTHR